MGGTGLVALKYFESKKLFPCFVNVGRFLNNNIINDHTFFAFCTFLQFTNSYD